MQRKHIGRIFFTWQKSQQLHIKRTFSAFCAVFLEYYIEQLYSVRPLLSNQSRLVKASPAPFTKSQPRTEVWSVVWLFGSMHLQSNFFRTEEKRLQWVSEHISVNRGERTRGEGGRGREGRGGDGGVRQESQRSKKKKKKSRDIRQVLK